jgi:hypothetical protein
MHKRLYVFMGVGCEYVLKPLADFLRVQGCECLEIDLMATFSMDWKRLANRPIVFITSAHLDKGKERAHHGARISAKCMPNLIAPLELLDILRPIKSIYIPHDLTLPLCHYEWQFIDQFDFFFNPIPFFSVYSGLTEIKEMGWIKYMPGTTTLPTDFVPQKKIIFVSLFDYLQEIYGLAGLFQYFEPLLDENTAIKFPLWTNHQEVENYFRKHSPATVYEAEWNSVELMHYFDVIIGNHLSSVLMEAAFLNKKVVCLESDIATPCPHYQRSVLGFLPNIQFFPYFNPLQITPLNDFLKTTLFSPLPLDALLKPFDFAQAYAVITE